METREENALDAHEFLRRFLLHVLPKGFHRIRHYGLLAGGVKADNPAKLLPLAWVLGRRPGSKTSMMRMVLPQHGHGVASTSAASTPTFRESQPSAL